MQILLVKGMERAVKCMYVDGLVCFCSLTDVHAPLEGECASRRDAPQLPDQSAEGSRAPAGVLRCLQSPSRTEKVSSNTGNDEAGRAIRAPHDCAQIQAV